MYLVQLLLPLYSRYGKALDRKLFDDVRTELVGRFGGITSYSRAPAKGLWQEPTGNTSKDDVVIYEVMVEELDRGWWEDYRRKLEARFEQDALIVRASPVDLL